MMVKINHLIPEEFNLVYLIPQYRILCPGKGAVLSSTKHKISCQCIEAVPSQYIQPEKHKK